MIQRDMMSDHGTSSEELEGEIGKSNWLENKEKTGTPVTVEEIDQLWQDGIQEVIGVEEMIKKVKPGDINNAETLYRIQRDTVKLHIHLWELRDAAVYALKQK